MRTSPIVFGIIAGLLGLGYAGLDRVLGSGAGSGVSALVYLWPLLSVVGAGFANYNLKVSGGLLIAAACGWFASYAGVDLNFITVGLIGLNGVGAACALQPEPDDSPPA